MIRLHYNDKSALLFSATTVLLAFYCQILRNINCEQWDALGQRADSHSQWPPPPALPLPPRLQPRDEPHEYLEWIEGPEIEHETGKPRPVSNEIETGETPNSVQISRGFTHTLSVRRGLEIDFGKLLEKIGAKYQLGLTTSEGTQSSLVHRISLDTRSIGRVVFTESIIHVKGKVRRTAECPFYLLLIRFGAGCGSSNETIEVDILSTELDEMGHAKGSYEVEYRGTNKFDHPEFYPLVDRYVNFSSGALPANGKIKSSYECAMHAIHLNKPVAIYNVTRMRCLLRNIQTTNGTLLDRFGHTLGAYESKLNPKESIVTHDERELEKWIHEEKCDLIHKFNDGERVKFRCKNFEVRPNHVLMFHRVPSREPQHPYQRLLYLENRAAPGEVHPPPSSSSPPVAKWPSASGGPMKDLLKELPAPAKKKKS